MVNKQVKIVSNFIIYISSFLFLSIITPSNAEASTRDENWDGNWRQKTLHEYPSFFSASSSGGSSPLSDSATQVSRQASSIASPIHLLESWYVSKAGNWVLPLIDEEYITVEGTMVRYRSGGNMTKHYCLSSQEAKLYAQTRAIQENRLLQRYG